MADDDGPDVIDVVREFGKAVGSVVGDFRQAFSKVFDEAEYRFDKEMGKQIAKHPELYAELKRGYKQFKRGLDKAMRDFNIK